MLYRLCSPIAAAAFVSGCGPACGWTHYGGGELILEITAGEEPVTETLVLGGVDEEAIETWVESVTMYGNESTVITGGVPPDWGPGAMLTWPHGDFSTAWVSAYTPIDGSALPCGEQLEGIILSLGFGVTTVEDLLTEGGELELWYLDGDSFFLNQLSFDSSPVVEESVEGSFTTEGAGNWNSPDPDEVFCDPELVSLNLSWSFDEPTRVEHPIECPKGPFEYP